MVAPNPQNGCTLVTPKVHAVTLVTQRLHPGYTNEARSLRPSDTQVKFGLQPSHTWVTPGLRPSTPESCPSLYPPMPGYVNPINTFCSVAPPPHPVHGWVAVARRFCTNVMPRLQPSRTWVERGVRPGHALATPWQPGYTRATPGSPRGHTRVTQQSSTSHARSTHPSYTRKPGGSAGTGAVPRGKKHQATHQVTPRGHPSGTQMAPVKPGLHQGHSEVTSKLRQVTPG